MESAIDTHEIQAIERQFTDIELLASEVEGEIQTQEQYESCLIVMSRGKELNKKWAAIFDPIREAQRTALEVTYATINKIKTPTENWIKILTPKCFRWEKRQETEAKALEQKRQEEARKAAEDAALAEAQHFATQGRPDVAEAILATPVHVPVVVAPPPTSVLSAAKLSRGTRWKARVVNFEALFAAVAAGTVPKTTVMENQAVLDGLAKALKGELNIPGVEVYEEPTYRGMK